jgi:hypothetical protein
MTCMKCATELQRVAGMAIFVLVRGDRQCVPCASGRAPAAADDDTPPPEPMRYAPGEITGESGQ